MRKAALLLAGATAIAACGDRPRAVIEKCYGVEEQMQDEVERAGADCAAAGRALYAFAERHRAEFARCREFNEKQGKSEAVLKLAPDFAERSTRIRHRMALSLQRCSGDPEFSKSVDRAAPILGG